MVTALFYDHTAPVSVIHGLGQSIISAAIIKNRFPDVTIYDTAGLNDGDTDALIATVPLLTYHRIYILVGVAAGHVDGDLKTTQVTTLNGSLIGITDPDSDVACREFGVNSGTLTPAFRTWGNTYAGIQAAPIITYLGDIAKYAYAYSTATAGDATSVTGTGTPFVANALIGKYVCIMSGTGIGDWAKITANTTSKITVTAWNKDTVMTVTNPAAGAVLVVYHDNWLCRVLANVYIPYGVMAYLSDVADANVFDKWKKLIDQNQNLLTFGGHAASWDETVYDEILTAGKAIFDYTNL